MHRIEKLLPQGDRRTTGLSDAVVTMVLQKPVLLEAYKIVFYANGGARIRGFMPLKKP